MWGEAERTRQRKTMNKINLLLWPFNSVVSSGPGASLFCSVIASGYVNTIALTLCGRASSSGIQPSVQKHNISSGFSKDWWQCAEASQAGHCFCVRREQQWRCKYREDRETPQHPSHSHRAPLGPNSTLISLSPGNKQTSGKLQRQTNPIAMY